MKTRGLSLKLLESPPPLSLATAPGPVFAMLDPPGVEDKHGDTMDAGALRLPEGVTEIPLYWVHSYHPDVVPDATPEQRLPVGTAVVWEEDGQWYFVPRFNLLTDLSQKVKDAVGAGDIAACSIGYRTVRSTPNGKGPEGGGEDVHEARLLEVSLVDVGAKAGAVRVKMDETQQQQELGAKLDALTQAVVTLGQGLTQLTASVTQLATAMNEEEEEDPSEPPEPGVAETKDGEGGSAPTPGDKENAPQDPPNASSEDPVTKWFRSWCPSGAPSPR